MDRAKQLEEERIPRLLFKFAIPAIVGMLVNALYNIVDKIFVGQGVEPLAIAGISVGLPITTLMMAFGMLIGTGATSLISIRLGEKKVEEAELILGNAMILGISTYFTISILGLIFLEPLLAFFGASSEIMPYGKEYMSIILFGAVFQGIGFIMNNFIRAEGNPKIAMKTMLIGAILNIILDPILILKFNMGIKGAAIATVISQIISAIWVLGYFFGGKSMLKIHRQNLRIKVHILLDIITIGSAPFAMQVATSILNVIMLNSLGKYGGDLAISAISAINGISMLILMPIFGINQGAQPIIGYNYGAKKFDRVKKTLKYAIFSATCIVTGGFIITRLFAPELIGLFGKNNREFIEIGTEGLHIFLFMLPIIGFQIVSSNYFQATGKPKQAMFLSLSRQVLILIPMILILPKFFGLKGVWMAAPISDLFASIITGIFLIRDLKTLN
ncbi:MAG TPA: MATE family efflux transporter [Clostridiales bacterium]|nr:MATE family efflux transporter [Clostridiales bacterium]